MLCSASGLQASRHSCLRLFVRRYKPKMRQVPCGKDGCCRSRDVHRASRIGFQSEVQRNAGEYGEAVLRQTDYMVSISCNDNEFTYAFYCFEVIAMQKSATLNLRVDPDVKQAAESVLSQLGLSMSTAIDIFLRQVALTGSIPFKVALAEAPRAVDADAMGDAELREKILSSLAEIDADKGISLSEAASMLSDSR